MAVWTKKDGLEIKYLQTMVCRNPSCKRYMWLETKEDIGNCQNCNERLTSNSHWVNVARQRRNAWINKKEGK